MLKWRLPLCGCYAADMFMWGLGWGGNNVLVTTLLMLRCQLGEVTSKTLWMPWCWHVEVMSTSIVAVVAVAATLAVEVWKCQWGPVQKDGKSWNKCEPTCGVKRHALHFLSRRDHVGTNQISTLGKRGIYRILSKNGRIWIHFVLIRFSFSKTCPTVIFPGIYSVFFNVLISDVLKRSRGFRSGGMYVPTCRKPNRRFVGF